MPSQTEFLDKNGKTLYAYPVVLVDDKTAESVEGDSITEFVDTDTRRIYATPLVVMEDRRRNTGGGLSIEITGTPGVGNVLTAVLPNGWTATGWQWYRNGTAIAGATAKTYTQVSADVGAVLTVGASGLAYRMPSGGVTVPGGVAPSAPAITSAPSIASAVAGSPLVFTSASVTGSPTPTVVYDVMQGTTVVASNVTSGSYTPPTAGVSISVRATATNSAGSTSSTSQAVTVASSIPANALLIDGYPVLIDGLPILIS